MFSGALGSLTSGVWTRPEAEVFAEVAVGRGVPPQDGVSPTFTAVPFPEGDLSFLHAIAPIGTKFAGPETMGPEGQPNESVGENTTQHMGAYAARLYFYFGGSERALTGPR